MPLGYHIRIRPRTSGTLIKTKEQRRVVARTVLGQGRKHDLLAFGPGKEHLHMHTGPEADPGQLARNVESGLTQSLHLDGGFERAHVEPIVKAGHMYNVFRYDLTQAAHHGLSGDPLFEGTNLPDLLAARLLGCYTANNVRRLLPGISREDLLQYLELETLEPADAPLDWLVAATLAAAGVPDLVGHGAEVSRARRAAIAVASDRLTPERLGQLLNVSKRTIYRLIRQRPNDRLVVAVRLQLGMMGQRAHAVLGSTGPYC